jgi:hypothetical protein
MEQNFGIPQISPFITNTALFDGKEDAAKAYAEKVSAGILGNVVGVDKPNYNAKMAKIITF